MVNTSEQSKSRAPILGIALLSFLLGGFTFLSAAWIFAPIDPPWTDRAVRAVKWAAEGIGQGVFSSALVNLIYVLILILAISPAVRRTIGQTAQAFSDRFMKHGGRLSVGGAFDFEIPAAGTPEPGGADNDVFTANTRFKKSLHTDGSTGYYKIENAYEFYRVYDQANRNRPVPEDIQRTISNLRASQNTLYKENESVFVGHRLVRTLDLDNKTYYEVDLFIRDCEDLNSRRIAKVEYYLGEGWDNLLFVSRCPWTQFAARIRAWGKFAAMARIHYWPDLDGEAGRTVPTWRYVDFFNNTPSVRPAEKTNEAT